MRILDAELQKNDPAWGCVRRTPRSFPSSAASGDADGTPGTSAAGGPLFC